MFLILHASEVTNNNLIIIQQKETSSGMENPSPAAVDSIIDNISKLIISQTESYNSGPTEDFLSPPEKATAPTDAEKEGSPKTKLEMLQSLKNAREEMTKKLQQELKNLQAPPNKARTHLATVAAGTRTSAVSNATETAERLLEFKKKSQEKIEAKIAQKLREEQEALKPKSVISSGSKKLIESKKYVPIYSKERLQQIEAAKKQKVDKLRQEMEEKKRQAEENDIATSVPSYKGAEITNVELCFDPNAVKPMVYQAPDPAAKKPLESTEDEELKKNCSFKPTTNKKSDQLFSKKNVKNKPVVERLMDYGKYKKELIEQKIAESTPTFQPMRVPQSRNSKTKVFYTKDEHGGDSKMEAAELENQPKKAFEVEDLRQLIQGAGNKRKELKDDASTIKTSVISKYII